MANLISQVYLVFYIFLTDMNRLDYYTIKKYLTCVDYLFNFHQ